MRRTPGGAPLVVDWLELRLSLIQSVGWVHTELWGQLDQTTRRTQVASYNAASEVVNLIMAVITASYVQGPAGGAVKAVR